MSSLGSVFLLLFFFLSSLCPSQPSRVEIDLCSHVIPSVRPVLNVPSSFVDWLVLLRFRNYFHMCLLFSRSLLAIRKPLGTFLTESNFDWTVKRNFLLRGILLTVGSPKSSVLFVCSESCFDFYFLTNPSTAGRLIHAPLDFLGYPYLP